jgi:oxygen-independent coproporphyrinogen-3 oxidase
MKHSIYFHIPFCQNRCAYCDFTTYAGHEGQIAEYVQSLCHEIEMVTSISPETIRVHTIFFGGGTPSLISIPQIEKILRTLDRITDHPLNKSIEITIEVNPGTIDLNYLRELRADGVNRISLGVQSFHPGELRMLERIHDPYDVINAVSWARSACFQNINLDLIFGLPEQELEQWTRNVKSAVALEPEHLSLYALTIEKNTPFGSWASKGILPIPDPDLAADMYLWASEYLGEKGYQQYEISNWAKPGYECQHNVQYWHNLPYLGFGAGAHGYSGEYRVANCKRIGDYIYRCKQPPCKEFPSSPATIQKIHISRIDAMQETMMTGLRLVQEGVAESDFQQRFECGLVDAFGNEIADLIRLDLLEWVGEEANRRLRLTTCGRLLGNQVFMRFVD